MTKLCFAGGLLKRTVSPLTEKTDTLAARNRRSKEHRRSWRRLKTMADPIQRRHHEGMNELARFIDVTLNGRRRPGVARNIGFVLLVAEFGKIDGGRVNYISNGDRADMIAMMKEYVARAEGAYADGVKTQQ